GPEAMRPPRQSSARRTARDRLGAGSSAGPASIECDTRAPGDDDMTPRAPLSFGKILLSSAPLALAAVLSLAGNARAINVTLGALAPPSSGGCGNCEVFQRRNGTGPSYRVPAGKWTITSWSTQGGGGGDGRARLVVFRQTLAGQFKLVKQSRRKTIPS